MIGVKADIRGEGFCYINIIGRFTADPDVECLLCPETFHHPEQHQVELQTKVREDNAVLQSPSMEKVPLTFASATHFLLVGAFDRDCKTSRNLREPSFEAQITTLLLCLGSGGWEQQQQPNDRMPFLLSSSWLWCRLRAGWCGQDAHYTGCGVTGPACHTVTTS